MGNPVGYYTLGLESQVDDGDTPILAHTNPMGETASDKLLLDDIIIEVDWQDDVVWEWHCSDHFHELGSDDAARTALCNNPSMCASGGRMSDWMHINSMPVPGPNKWYSIGDMCFHPSNIIWDTHGPGIIAIIDRQSSKIAW